MIAPNGMRHRTTDIVDQPLPQSLDEELGLSLWALGPFPYHVEGMGPWSQATPYHQGRATPRRRGPLRTGRA
jgi:hypothetical protein